MWANNGDVVSRQYAGTNALKGDFTRTGERNISGLMKDGVNSASRYYLNHSRDAFRQAAIDLFTGQPLSDEFVDSLTGAPDDLEILSSKTMAEGDDDKEEEDLEATAERIRSLIDDCKKLLIPDLSSVVGAWGLIDSDAVTGDPRQTDLDIVFIVTKDAYYVARYEHETEKVTQYQKVLLANVERVDLGAVDQLFSLSFGGRGAAAAKEEVVNLRLSYRMPSAEVGARDSGYYHQFRPIDFRFFNNVTVKISTREERLESLRGVAEALLVAAEADAEATGKEEDVLWVEDGRATEVEKPPPLVMREGKLDRRKSKAVEQHPSYAPVGGPRFECQSSQ